MHRQVVFPFFFFFSPCLCVSVVSCLCPFRVFARRVPACGKFRVLKQPVPPSFGKPAGGLPSPWGAEAVSHAGGGVQAALAGNAGLDLPA
jgi:hypothetical protein